MTSFVSLRRAVAFAAFGLLMGLLFGCKEDTLLGHNIIPGSDYLNGTFTDTLTLKTTTVREDSLPTRNLTKYVLGATQDAVFGEAFAGIYTQFSLPTANINFNDTAYVDSVVLAMSYAGYYGDTTSYQCLRVYQLNQNIVYGGADSTVYSNQTFGHDAQMVGYKCGFRIFPYTKYTEGTQTFAPQLRIRLDTAVGHELLAPTDYAVYANATAFKQYFKGLYIEPDTAPLFGSFTKLMMYLNLRNGESQLTVYYRTPHTTGNALRFRTDADAVNSNYFKHKHGTVITQALAHQLTDSAVFVQSMASVKTKITLPYLQNLGNVIVNKAQIEVTQLKTFADVDSGFYHAPAKMLIVESDANGYNHELIDQTFQSPYPIYNGSQQTITENGITYTRYKFDIAAQVQKMLVNPSANYGLYLITFPSNSIADRIIVGGADRPKTDPYRMKLNLVYTKIP